MLDYHYGIAEACKATIQSFLPKANIIKISDEEIEFVTGISDEHKAIQSLFKGNVEVVIYTQGDKGATAYLKRWDNYSSSRV